MFIGIIQTIETKNRKMITDSIYDNANRLSFICFVNMLSIKVALCVVIYSCRSGN